MTLSVPRVGPQYLPAGRRNSYRYLIITGTSYLTLRGHVTKCGHIGFAACPDRAVSAPPRDSNKPLIQCFDATLRVNRRFGHRRDLATPMPVYQKSYNIAQVGSNVEVPVWPSATSAEPKVDICRQGETDENV